MDITKSKLKCMDLFYSCVDRDIVGGRFIDYETSFGQAFTYDFNELSQLEKAIWCFTMVIRFSRSGMLLEKNAILEKETTKSINFLKQANWDKLELSDNDKKQLYADFLEVMRYFDWLEEQRN